MYVCMYVCIYIYRHTHKKMHLGQPACLTGRTSQLIKRAPQPPPFLPLRSFRPFTSRPFLFFLYIRSLWPCGDAHATKAMSPAGSFGTRWGRARPAGSWIPRQELRCQAEASLTRRERQRYSQSRRPPQGAMVPHRSKLGPQVLAARGTLATSSQGATA
jgi:hypothetical protein